MTMHPRSLARSMAKHQLEAEGATGINKRKPINGAKAPSYFSRYWKKFAIKATQIKKGGKK